MSIFFIFGGWVVSGGVVRVGMRWQFVGYAYVSMVGKDLWENRGGDLDSGFGMRLGEVVERDLFIVRISIANMWLKLAMIWLLT